MTMTWLSCFKEDTRYRLGIASRVLAAIAGGYFLVPAIQLLLVLLLDDRTGAMLIIYAIHTGILMWTFHTRSATRAWVWLLGWTTMAYVICWLLIQKGGAA